MLGSSRVRRFVLQSAARDLLPRERVAFCLRRRIPDRAMIDVLYSPEGKSGAYAGLMACGSVWMCPVCAAKISEKRRKDLSSALSAWSGKVVLATFTLRHNAGENLADVLARLKKARSLLVSGKWAKGFNERHKVAGSVRSLEVTYGANGWHPHLHVLIFLEDEPDASFADELGRRWLHCVQAAGGSASLAAFDVRVTDDAVADYVAKFGREPSWTAAHEMTKAVTKQAHPSGRTPMQLLAEYTAGDKAAGRLWLQYAITMTGERQLWWSQGLRARLGLVVEKSDQELAEEQTEQAVLLAQLRSDQWRVVLANDARGELLEVAGTGSADLVCAFLASLGLDVLPVAARSAAAGGSSGDTPGVGGFVKGSGTDLVAWETLTGDGSSASAAAGDQAPGDQGDQAPGDQGDQAPGDQAGTRAGARQQKTGHTPGQGARPVLGTASRSARRLLRE